MSGLTNCYGKLQVDSSLETITFKSHKGFFPNACEYMHFGRVRGSNRLSGRNINVVGTYNYNVSYYRFLSYVMGIEYEDLKMNYQQVHFDGRTFMFMTFNNPQLQLLHLKNVKGELLQAVHRARLLRNNCVVNLYSNFPLLQANYKY